VRVASFVASLRDDLAAVAALGDEQTAAVAARLADAMVRPISAALLELLGEIAAELDAKLPQGRVEVRLLGQDAELVYVEENETTEEPDAEATARITLRLSEQLKARVEQAAARDGVSVNTYVVRALQQRSRASGPLVGHRLSGYGRS